MQCVRSFGANTNVRAAKWTSCLFMSPSLWPEPNASAAGVRTSSLLQYFGRPELFESVHYAGPKQTGSAQKEMNVVQPHELTVNRSEQIRHLLLEKVKPEVVVFDRFFAEEAYSFQIRKYAPNAVRILDMQDFHALRHARQQLLQSYLMDDMTKESLSSCQNNHNSGEMLSAIMKCKPCIIDSDILKRELASIHRSDLVLVCSKAELRLLNNEYGVDQNKMVVAPFFCESPQDDDNDDLPTSFEERQVDFVTIGGFRHGPNVDAAIWLYEQIWPKIRHFLPHAQLKLYGAYVNQKIQNLHDPKNGFLVCGYVDNLKEALLQARVMLAPLRYGAGIKGKIVDAWGHGLPVVTTPIGSEGMEDKEFDGNWGGSIATNLEDFVADAVNLHSNEHYWTKCQTNALALHSKLFNADRNLRQVTDAMIKSSNELKTIRKNNLIGNLLWHQSARSTEYFSRWIELKEITKNKR